MAGIEVTEFRPQRSGALLGFATVEIAAIGLTVRDCPVLESGGRRWVNLPGRPVVDRDGRAKTEDGKRVLRAHGRVVVPAPCRPLSPTRWSPR